MRAVQNIVEQGKRVFIFLGEAGSGKSEIAVNWALALSNLGKPPRFFDLDQTKPLFRSRTLAGLLRKHQIVIDECRQVLDAPTLPTAVVDRICEVGVYAVLDIGGNERGAKCIGQFAEAWSESCAAYIVINYYRPFSDQQYNLLRTMEEVAATARVKEVKIISNPNFGAETTFTDIKNGHNCLTTILRNTNYEIAMLAVPDVLVTDAKREFSGMQIIGINRYITTPWEDDQHSKKEDRHGAD